jgi:hypothetical protein
MKKKINWASGPIASSPGNCCPVIPVACARDQRKNPKLTRNNMISVSCTMDVTCFICNWVLWLKDDAQGFDESLGESGEKCLVWVETDAKLFATTARV